MIDKIIITSKNNKLENFIKNLKKLFGLNKIKYLSNRDLILDSLKGESNLFILKNDSINFNPVKLIKEIIESNPYNNIVLLSNDTSNIFKDQFEGLGIVMQLPNFPNASNAKELYNRLQSCLVNIEGGKL